ncbi:UDP-N-acetylmuramoyl-L-alanine--D-glutamate ligase [Aquifex aeolicus]|uniref:UDP-N-acetylmuramoylalanine--D-glutamate ligase n=1 Tax=Aquifex aeolicus (strain VF5) TaxID=224324 RepID=MURD_AQUAE|nr:UDP-N-acetylmuramoyl-L-alanine--D-glutamate ligase [Aquifex aeolicus]O67852.1 RecName: Full=UDP-N-acetylmuramoylalanine--D-glutamate ligase; AltName: Full=D-glutamic acid-adding enzyme; AltName: Full=UDP-N-acetylmuramoyl-L-alanyl-D-glutamate synthetase [Aquifex aeolicus VF5]AAC07814.1 UDP-N-acetylmuramoylalanine-D-glutamate ligase [Aquifex aeolicus VF5]
MKFLVWGLGRSGKGALKLLKERGFEVYAGDDSQNPELWREVLGEVDTVVLSPGIPPSHPLWKEALKKEKEVVGELELAYRFFKGKVIAITGTDGKSTTTRLTYLILKKFFDEVFEAGNIGKPFSEVVLENPEGIAVLEVSSFQGKTLKTFRPNIGAFISFSVDHLDWHPSIEDYLKSKYRIFENQTEEDFLILNDLVYEIKKTPSRARKVLFSELYINSDSVFYKDIRLFNPKNLKIRGLHNVYNASVASLIALTLGLKPEDFEEVIYEFRGLPHRLEFLGNFNGVEVYNDSKSTTPHALMHALKTFPDNSVILIVGGKDKGADFYSLRHIVQKKVKIALAIGETKEKIKDSWKDITEVKTCNTLEEAVKLAREVSKLGNVVLFSPACSSFDMFRNYEERGEKFKELVEIWFTRT